MSLQRRWNAKEAAEAWMGNEGWEFADREAAWKWMFELGYVAAAKQAQDELHYLAYIFDAKGLEGAPLIGESADRLSQLTIEAIGKK